uniref:Uncharacterized protein n=1 Tax=Aegilops tauschii subsp. strangulata TaxID=200361 RepID=A0A453PTD2_AEGTS
GARRRAGEGGGGGAEGREARVPGGGVGGEPGGGGAVGPNVIGDIHKRRGEYVEALRWLRLDYDVTVKYLPQRHLLESCQSLGEVHLRLGQFPQALTYQVRPPATAPGTKS